MQAYSAAIETMDAAYIAITTTSVEFLRLYGYICAKLSPPDLEKAIQSFSEVIKRSPKDLEAVRCLFIHKCCSSDKFSPVVGTGELLLRFAGLLPRHQGSQ